MFSCTVIVSSESPMFEHWREGKLDAFNRPTTPLPLLVLFFLHYLGQGWTFDDLSENTGISDVHAKEYEKSGKPGCLGSMDAMHIFLEKVEYWLCQSHLGFKSSHTCCTCNITVNNRRQILATTMCHPARWNDKNVVLLMILLWRCMKAKHFKM